MSKRKFILGPDVENGDKTVVQSRDKVFARHSLQRIACVEVVGHDAIDLGDVPLADAPQGLDQINHLGISGKTIEHSLAVPPCLDKSSASKDLKVARGVGKAEARPRCKSLDAPFTLGEVLQQFQPVRMPESLSYFGKAGENRLFRSDA